MKNSTFTLCTLSHNFVYSFQDYITASEHILACYVRKSSNAQQAGGKLRLVLTSLKEPLTLITRCSNLPV